MSRSTVRVEAWMLLRARTVCSEVVEGLVLRRWEQGAARCLSPCIVKVWGPRRCYTWATVAVPGRWGVRSVWRVRRVIHKPRPTDSCLLSNGSLILNPCNGSVAKLGCKVACTYCARASCCRAFCLVPRPALHHASSEWRTSA